MRCRDEVPEPARPRAERSATWAAPDLVEGRSGLIGAPDGPLMAAREPPSGARAVAHGRLRTRHDRA